MIPSSPVADPAVTLTPALEGEVTIGFRPGAIALIVDGNPNVSRWKEFGAEIGRAASSHQWVIGDWILHGERSWQVTYAIASDATGLAENTLRNCRTIAARFEFSRRRENLTWGHHAEVSAIDQTAADAILERAERKGLTLRQVRELAAQHRPVPELLALEREHLRVGRQTLVKAKQDLGPLLSPGARAELDHVIAEIDQLIVEMDRRSAAPPLAAVGIEKPTAAQLRERLRARNAV